MKTKKRPDKYDQAIAYLTKHPEKILAAWAVRGPGDSLYNEHQLFRTTRPGCGCLTQIRANDKITAPTPELTKAIKADNRIPMHPTEITVKDLPVFAEWQRRLDKELGRK